MVAASSGVVQRSQLADRQRRLQPQRRCHSPCRHRDQLPHRQLPEQLHPPKPGVYLDDRIDRTTATRRRRRPQRRKQRLLQLIRKQQQQPPQTATHGHLHDSVSRSGPQAAENNLHLSTRSRRIHEQRIAAHLHPIRIVRHAEQVCQQLSVGEGKAERLTAEVQLERSPLSQVAERTQAGVSRANRRYGEASRPQASPRRG